MKQNKMPTTYIAGKITGLDLMTAKNNFLVAKMELNARFFYPVSPMDGIEKGEYSWQYYMQRGIKMLMSCDSIYILKGWRKSKGARIERWIAKKLGYDIYYQKY